ncbi:MAG: hypothetical protein ACRDTZ_16040 [Pseudonocardiaceae bacterium]
MNTVTRAVAGLGLTAAMTLAGAGAASAQEPAPPTEPVANCGFLSAVVCQVAIPVGPVIFFPNGLAPGGPPVPVIPIVG